MNEMTDAEIDRRIAVVLAGDPEAFAPLVELHQEGVWRLVAFLMQGAAAAAVEDVVQQAFIQAYDKLDRFERGRDFGAWLRGIARNCARKHLRGLERERQRHRRFGELLERRANERLDACEADAQAEERRVHRLALRRCLERLSEDARALLTAYYQAGDSLATIGKRLQRSEAACRKLLGRTRLRLRDCIDTQLRVSAAPSRESTS